MDLETNSNLSSCAQCAIIVDVLHKCTIRENTLGVRHCSDSQLKVMIIMDGYPRYPGYPGRYSSYCTPYCIVGTDIIKG